MFEITPSGGSSVKITTKTDTLWIDPKARHMADKSSELKDAVQIATQPKLLQEQNGDKPRLEGPGEYEAGPFALTGFAVEAYGDESLVTSYRIEVKGIAIGLLGNGKTELNEDQLETLGIVDLLVLPVVDGVVGASAHQAAQLVRRIEPKAVVPVGIAVMDATQEPSSAALADFVKELSATVETGNKLKIKSSGDIPAALTVYLPE